MTSFLTRLPWVTRLSQVRAAQEVMVEMAVREVTRVTAETAVKEDQVVLMGGKLEMVEQEAS